MNLISRLKALFLKKLRSPEIVVPISCKNNNIMLTYLLKKLNVLCYAYKKFKYKHNTLCIHCETSRK